MNKSPSIINGLVQLRKTRQRRLVQRLLKPHLLVIYALCFAAVVAGAAMVAVRFF